MQIDSSTVEILAHLARLEFDEKGKQAIIHDLNRMLAFVEKLNELDTKDVEPLIYMSEENNILREDEVEVSISQKEALLNAPKKDSDYFKVPKVITKQS
jgi:aspartyl-tRNA(Asn)/glutamyl-tRNA(Gln) amidotransferase subunit C